MNLLTRIISVTLGFFRGYEARQKYIYQQQAKKEEQRLKNFWLK